jgi:hypothetical protein
MFRLWGKEFKDNHMLRDTVICDETDDTRTHKIFNALDSICYEFLASQSGWIIILMNSKDMTRQDSIRIILWIPLILTIWRFILLKNKLCINNKKRSQASTVY